MARHSEKRLHRNSTDDLTDDLIVEILSRLPVKSVCRFKCVSWYWRGLIAHPDHRRKLPQTLSGFFCSNKVDGDGTVSNPYIVSDTDSDDDDGCYGTASFPIPVWDTEDEENDDYVDAVTEISVPNFASILPAEEVQSPVVPDPSLSFLPGYKSIVPKHCCGGHLVCFYWEVPPPTTAEAQYVVCNPATQQWRTFPRGHRRSTPDKAPPLYLCLDDDDDPATSSHFHVFALITNRDSLITGVDIYSSEAGAWSHNDNDWGDEIMVLHPGVLLDGMLHLITVADSMIVAVDRNGETWNTIPLLEDMYDAEFCASSKIDPVIGKSQGRLLYMNDNRDDHFAISVWILEDYYSGGRWVLRCKYNINTPEVFGSEVPEKEKVYNLVAVHPDCHLIFFTVGYRKFMSYDMDRGEVRVVGIMKSCTRGWRVDPYIPYVPSFSRAIC